MSRWSRSQLIFTHINDDVLIDPARYVGAASFRHAHRGIDAVTRAFHAIL
jgi:hypothetical protein